MLFCLLAGVLTAEAQTVVAPAPTASLTPPAFRPAEGNVNEAVPPGAADAGNVQATSPFKWGPVTAHPHPFYRFLYGDGIQARPGHQSTTAINSLAPGVLFDLGTHWTLDYTPTWTLYSDSQFKDTLDHAVNLAGGTAYEDWILQLSQGYTYSDDPIVETGSQTTRQSSSTAFTASYRFGSHMSLASTISQNLQFAKGFSNSREWADLEQLHYQFSQQLDTAIGLGFGYVNVSNGPDMTYTRPNAQVAWHPTEKTGLEAHAGFETRKFRSSHASNLNSPVFGASVQYQPVTTTKLALGADREVDVSTFGNQVTKTTRLSADLEQRLLQNFYLSTGVAHQKVTYVSSVSNASAGREDKFYSFNVKLSTTFLGRGTIGIFYQSSHNTSTGAGFAFSSHQGGFEIGYRY